jgi:hypothetical protein
VALDVYVMPMWRFKAGDLTTGVQRQFADRATIVSPLGFLRLQNIKATLARRSAVRQVRAVVKEAEQSLGARLQWRDEGEVVFSQQAWWGFEALRAYAKWLDLKDQFSVFEDPPESNFYKHPALKFEAPARQFRYSHIIDHSCYAGYYVPCHFDRVVYVDSYQAYGRFTFQRSFGSSYTLNDQLCSLEREMPQDDDPVVSESSRSAITAGFETLKDLCGHSLLHKLPIVFWG